ncbi:hypothetical protein E8E15_000913 [Penicillium rubens]|nr:hypothetical protein E8E15_000913 [Penicillium rubens]
MTVGAPRVAEGFQFHQPKSGLHFRLSPTALDHKCNYMPPYVRGLSGLDRSNSVLSETANSSYYGPTVPVEYATLGSTQGRTFRRQRNTLRKSSASKPDESDDGIPVPSAPELSIHWDSIL